MRCGPRCGHRRTAEGADADGAAIVDAGIPEDRNRMALFLARQWERFGDRMRDEAALMESVGLTVVSREEFGPWRCMRVVVGER